MRAQQKYLSIAILAITLSGLAYYIARNWADFEHLSFANPLCIVAMILLVFPYYFVVGLITRELTQALGLLLGVSEAFVISVMTGFYNMVLPFRGGIATRAVYLKTRHEYSYTKFLATLSAGYILTFLVASFLGLASLLLTYASMGLLSQVLLVTFLAIFLAMLVIMLWSPSLAETRFEWVNRFVRVINAWRTIKEHRGLIPLTTLLTLLQLLLETAITFLGFRVFGLSVPFDKCVFLAAVGSLGQLIQVTPAGLGVNEALLVFSTQAIGVLPAETLAVALLGRAVNLVFLGTLGPLSAYVLFRKVVLPDQPN